MLRWYLPEIKCQSNSGQRNKMKIKTVGLKIEMINSELRKKQKQQKGFTAVKNHKVGIAIKSMKESEKRIISQLKLGNEIFSQYYCSIKIFHSPFIRI
jgi:hypothetical protein